MEPVDERGGGGTGGVSKVKLALGAASLFLFIVGVKRTYQSGEAESPPASDRRRRGKD